MTLFLYPLRASPLFLSVLVSSCIWLIFYNAFFLLAMSSLMMVVIPAQARYLFIILEHTANGHSEPPSLDKKVLRPFSEWRHIQFVITSGVLVSFTSWLSAGGYATVAILLNIIALIVLPAFIGLLAASRRLLTAVNPLALLAFMAKIGSGYWVMMVVVCLLTALVTTLFSQQKDSFIAIYITLYTLILLFHWLGKLVYNNRHEFDFAPDKSPEREADVEAQALLKQRQACLYRVHQELALNNAADTIGQYVETEENKLDAHRWFHEAMMAWENKRAVMLHGKVYIEALRAAGKTAAADYLVERLRGIDSDFGQFSQR